MKEASCLGRLFHWSGPGGEPVRSRSEAETAEQREANPVGCTDSPLPTQTSTLARGQIVHHRCDDPAEQGGRNQAADDHPRQGRIER
jgi:hypothetical protein